MGGPLRAFAANAHIPVSREIHSESVYNPLGHPKTLTQHMLHETMSAQGNKVYEL
jgi:hypothetical protein